tara:strand:- start:2050 stop:2745 length:696 start_codon:yes stop_codon:yes gene_type:complete
MNYVAIIPARSGSKEIINKNIQDLNGLPMVVHTFIAAKNAKLIDSVYISTNDKNIVNLANSYDVEVPFIRPESLSSDQSTTLEVVIHFLDWFIVHKKVLPLNFVLLQPTSPLRDSSDINEAIKKFEKSNSKSLFSACKVSQHPFEMFHMESESNLDFFYQKNNKVEVKIRQHFRDVYFEDGAIYICNTEWFLKNKVFLNKYSDVTIMNKNHSIDIDSHEDLSLARLLIKKN